jgi:hypothetical protein
VEEDLIKPELTAVSKLRLLLENNFISPYVRKNNERKARSEAILSNQGTKARNSIGDNDDIVLQDGMYFGDMENDVLTSRTINKPLNFGLNANDVKRFDSTDRIVYKNFINQQLAGYNSLQRIENQIDASDDLESIGIAALPKIHRVRNHTERQIKLQESLKTFKKLQLIAYNKVVTAVTNNTKQLIMFMTGEGRIIYC